ncbi:MAG TPA: NAD(+)/NADH kinase [Candidatus Latescibacteria bacterium]|nr:ATP-NAD kinase [Gemmatimonadota bacterium]MDP7362987.1 NAD(+)/NADH kinase [Candidatus Latescibacterota bacterium]HCV23432.1 ATP-NAD kinase [Candidatus Latescibacterota bacterium]HJN28954.1 NAD(+)/NADH kinase [Candidatus Latescibacterota bacterium]
MIDLRRVGVLVRDDDQDFPLEEVGNLFARHGIELVALGDPSIPADLDLVVAMGGDGTVLRSLDLCPESPVLAINYGTVGFLTAGDRTELDQILSRLVAGDYLVSERLVLQCRYPAGQLRAVNEVMVRTSNRLVFVDVYVDGTKIRTICADGVVVGTPTGSTGFLLSAGAPIVMPEVRCLVLDGINEYNFTSRSLILTPESKIRLVITPETKEPSVLLTSDGRPMGDLTPGDELHIEQAETRARLIYFEKSYFYHNLTSKLSW